MAEGAWVPAYDSIWNSPKTRRFAHELKLPIENAAAKYLKLMAWARDTVESGELGTVADRSHFALEIGLAPRRGDEVYRALQLARFITDDERGYVIGWMDGPGHLVASRQRDRLRKAHDRGSHDPVSGGHPVDNCPKCARPAAVGPGTLKPLGGSSRPPSTPVTRSSHPRYTTSSSGLGAAVPTVSSGQDASLSTDKKEEPNLSTGRPLDAPNLSTRTDREDRHNRQSPLPQDAPGQPDPQDGAARLAWVLASVGEDHRWRDVVAELAKSQPIANVETWFTKTRAEPFGDGLVVVVPNSFAADWVGTKYTARIREAVAALGIAQPRTISALTEEQLATAKADRIQEGPEADADRAEPEIPDAPTPDLDQPYARVREGGPA